MPLRTGAARDAARGRRRGGRGVALVPVGLVFHEPGTFRAGRALLRIDGAVATADLHRSLRERSRRGYAPNAPSAHGGTPAADRRSRRPRDASLLRVVESISRDEAPSNARGFFRLLLDRDLRRRPAAAGDRSWTSWRP